MVFLLLLSSVSPRAVAGPELPAAPEATQVCTAKGRVALDPGLRRRIRGLSSCSNVVSAQRVADYMKAFAVLSRELSDPTVASQLTGTVEARWLLVRDGRSFRVFDAEKKAFVDPAGFVDGDAADPAEAAYRLGYQALRKKRYDEAKTQLSTCLEHEPEHVGCHWELGWVHWVAEDWAAAAASWSAVQEHDPDHPDVDTWLAKAKSKTKE